MDNYYVSLALEKLNDAHKDLTKAISYAKQGGATKQQLSRQKRALRLIELSIEMYLLNISKEEK